MQMHFLRGGKKKHSGDSSQAESAQLLHLLFHPFCPWRKATKLPRINGSAQAIGTLWEAPFLLQQRLIVTHSSARPQEMSSTASRRRAFFTSLMQFLHLWEKKTEFKSAKVKHYLILLVENSIRLLYETATVGKALRTKP